MSPEKSESLTHGYDQEEPSSFDESNQSEEDNHKKTTARTLHYCVALKKILLPLGGLGLLVGILAGIIVGSFIFCEVTVINQTKKLFALVRSHLVYLPVAFLVAIALALILGTILYHFPDIRGSGIPFILSVARGEASTRWYCALPLMYLCSMISLFSGYSLGAEGPSVYLGGTVGYSVGKILKLNDMHDMLLVAAGSSAGLSIAFNAPLSGLIFAIEEVYKKFSMQIIVTSILTVAFAQVADHLLFVPVSCDVGPLPFLNFSILEFVISAIAGIVGGLVGVAFNWLIRQSSRVYGKIPHFKPWAHPIVPAIVSVIVGIWWEDASYGGSDILGIALRNEATITRLIITFFIKFFFIMICFGSKASGGIFIPMFSIGAILGGIVAKVCLLCGLPSEKYTYVAIMTMSAFFCAVVRAPLTSAIIPVEYTGRFTGWLGPITAVAFAYIVAEMLRVRPLYDALVDLIVKEREERPDPYRFIFQVHDNSMVCGMTIREIMFPDYEKTAIVEIIRNNVPLAPYENIKLLNGDELIIESETNDPDDISAQLQVLF